MNFIQNILGRIRRFGNLFSGTFGNMYRVMYTGCIYKMNYTNYKHDPSPLILCLYSGVRYTHALNLNYLSTPEKQYLARLIYALKSGRQLISGQALYMLLKRDVYTSVVRKAYRTYFSNMIIQPRMVSAGWTQMQRMEYPYNDPFIIGLNRYLSNSVIRNNVQVAYYPQELQNRIIQAINSVPVGRGSTTPTQVATTPTHSATTPTTVNIG